MNQGEWPTGGLFPSLQILADHYGVSRMSVRQAVTLLREEGRLELGVGRRLFVQDPEGTPSVMRRLVLQVVSSLYDETLINQPGWQLQRGVDYEVTLQSRSLLLAHHFKYLYAMPSGLEQLHITGILLRGHFRNEVIRAYEKMPVPVVAIDRPRQNRRMHAAAVDNEEAAFDATRRLIQLGHRRIAFVRMVLVHSRERDPDSMERQAGYLRALKEAGLRTDAKLIVNSLSTDHADSASIQALFAKRARVTAVLAVDATKAGLVSKAARARGLSVPKDLSLVCFQEIDPDRQHYSGPRIDFHALGLEAARLLREPKKPFLERRIQTTWHEGKTMASPA